MYCILIYPHNPIIISCTIMYEYVYYISVLTVNDRPGTFSYINIHFDMYDKYM